MIRVITSLLLALVLALTSQSMAVARGASAATGQMVLCTGTGPVVIYMDAEGQPTSAPHICPDAALHVLVDVDMPDLAVPWALAWSDTSARFPTMRAPVRPRMAPPSRGPPALV